jgi:hypothetical protein
VNGVNTVWDFDEAADEGLIVESSPLTVERNRCTFIEMDGLEVGGHWYCRFAEDEHLVDGFI